MTTPKTPVRLTPSPVELVRRLRERLEAWRTSFQQQGDIVRLSNLAADAIAALESLTAPGDNGELAAVEAALDWLRASALTVGDKAVWRAYETVRDYIRSQRPPPPQTREEGS